MPRLASHRPDIDNDTYLKSVWWHVATPKLLCLQLVCLHFWKPQVVSLLVGLLLFKAAVKRKFRQ